MNNNLKNSINIDQFTDSISTRNLKICVIGVGRIGLPTALSFANSGLLTVGVYINAKLVEMILKQALKECDPTWSTITLQK